MRNTRHLYIMLEEFFCIKANLQFSYQTYHEKSLITTSNVDTLAVKS